MAFAGIARVGTRRALMDKRTAEMRFNEADRLYREERFAAALDLLKEIDARFPGRQNVMFPMARCLSKLGRNDEALRVCNEIVDKFDYDRATELRNRILHDGTDGSTTSSTDEEHFSFESLDLTMDEGPAAAMRQSSTEVHPLIRIVAVTVIVFAAFAAWYVVLW